MRGYLIIRMGQRQTRFLRGGNQSEWNLEEDSLLSPPSAADVPSLWPVRPSLSRGR